MGWIERGVVTRGVAGGVAVMLGLAGCSHSLEVKNLPLYKPAFVSNQGASIKVGLTASTASPEEERLAMAIANTLKRDGFAVTYPFHPTADNRQSVDYMVHLHTSSQYKGSGWNFLINWPGFIVWAPAWHGYKYRVIYGFDADITNAKTDATLPRISSPIDLDIRHADIGRTWTEISWLEWSAIAFIGGLLFTRYDHDITPELLDRTEMKIADYVSSKIGQALVAAHQSIASLWRPSQWVFKPHKIVVSLNAP